MYPFKNFQYFIHITFKLFGKTFYSFYIRPSLHLRRGTDPKCGQELYQELCRRVFGRCHHRVGPVSYTHLDVYKRQVLDDPAQQEQIRTEIATLTAQIKELRREVKLCGDIALRSVSIKDKIRAAREEQQAGKTEKGRLEPERAGRPSERR